MINPQELRIGNIAMKNRQIHKRSNKYKLTKIEYINMGEQVWISSPEFQGKIWHISTLKDLPIIFFPKHLASNPIFLEEAFRRFRKFKEEHPL